jgi:hypothetical protein
MKLYALLRTWLTRGSTDALTLPSVCVKDTGTAKGRGVFALRAFDSGEVVELCPVIVLGTPYLALPEDLKKLVFHWELRDGLPEIQATEALALGYGSLYNHNDPANLRFETDKPALLIRFITVRHINVGEELTVNYNSDGGAATADSNWWFAEKKIKPIVGS